MVEDPVIAGELAYEYLACEANMTYGPNFSDWPAYSLLNGCAPSGFFTSPSQTFVPIFALFP
jgi:hypothetical protein